MSRKRKDSQFRCINKSNNTEKLPPAENFHHFLTWKIFDAKVEFDYSTVEFIKKIFFQSNANHAQTPINTGVSANKKNWPLSKREKPIERFNRILGFYASS